MTCSADATAPHSTSAQDEKWLATLKDMVKSVVSQMVVVQGDQQSALPLAYQEARGITFAYGEQALDLVNRTNAHLLTQKSWGLKVSEKFVSDRLMRLVRTLLVEKGDERLDAHLGEFLQDIAGSVSRQTVFVPVFGLSMRVDSWKIGSVELLNVTQGLLDRWCSEVHEVYVPLLRAGVGVGVYVRCACEAEANRAKELAYEETRRVIDLLRFSVALKANGGRGRYVIAPEEEINLQPENRNICIIPDGLRSFEVNSRAA